MCIGYRRFRLVHRRRMIEGIPEIQSYSISSLSGWTRRDNTYHSECVGGSQPGWRNTAETLGGPLVWINKTVNLDFESGVWTSVSQLARDLIARMLCRDVCKRLSADDVLRHPWILFYTQPSLTGLTFKPKVRKAVRATTLRHVTVESSVEYISNQLKSTGFRRNDANPSLAGSSKSDEHDNGFVDVLAVAISQMSISEPKRIRLCNPASPTQQQTSSNLKTNLCTAF